MDANKFEEVKQRIRAACDHALAEGLKILPLLHGGRLVGQCCPMGAVVLDDPPRWVVSDDLPAQAKLGITSGECWSFVAGFDGKPVGDYCNREPDQQMYELGQEFRRQYVPEVQP